MLTEKLAVLPAKTGVYLFKNKRGRVIYVGKALNLRSRVSSYFSAGHSISPRTRVLVKNIADVEYLLTDSEIEALILESNLIKRHRPKYNIRLTDDKSYPYLRITLGEEYPRLEITRRLLKDGSRYFGPYPNVGAVQEILKLLQRIFPLRTCKQKKVKKKQRPCLNAYLGRCLAPCQGEVNKETYQELIKEVIHFLEGKEEKIVVKLTKEMQAAAEKLNFEKAAELRDQLRAIAEVREKQKVVSTSFADFDLLNYVGKPELACVQLFFVRGGKLIGSDYFLLEGEVEKEAEEVISAFLKQYYHQAKVIPRQVFLPVEVAEKSVLETWLAEKRGGRVVLQVPQRGLKKRLLILAAKNAQENLERELQLRKQRRQTRQKALADLAEILDLAEPPWRIEGFDLSGFQGSAVVAGMVVFEEGRPFPDQYRRFKVKTVEGSDDFAGLSEVLKRRLMRGLAGEQRFAIWPDLILVDGGRGQLSAVTKVRDELALAIPIIALTEQGEVFFEGCSIVLTDEAFNLLAQIRDEVHRFAITYHRLLRGKQSLSLVLDEIPGLGPQRRTALLEHFQFSLAKIRQASLEELKAVKGVGPKLAQQIWNFFQVSEE